MCAFVHSCGHACVHAYVHEYVHAYVHEYVHAYVHALCSSWRVCVLFVRIISILSYRVKTAIKIEIKHRLWSFFFLFFLVGSFLIGG